MSVIGNLLGDSVTGSCWRAVESAATPGVEVRIFVRSLAEALLSLDLVDAIASTRGLLPKTIDVASSKKLAAELDALVAVELTNGSVIAFKKENEAGARAMSHVPTEPGTRGVA